VVIRKYFLAVGGSYFLQVMLHNRMTCAAERELKCLCAVDSSRMVPARAANKTQSRMIPRDQPDAQRSGILGPLPLLRRLTYGPHRLGLDVRLDRIARR
jgi:hypothetical protein